MIIDSRDPYDLDPRTFAMFTEWKARCAAVGIDVKLISGYRNKERQDQIYNTVDANGHRATKAHGGQSFHQYRVAWDFCVMKNGKIDWNDAAAYKRAGAIGEAIGCFWGGRWTSLGDNGHLQSDHNSSIAEAGWLAKYPSGERPKTWSNADCDAMHNLMYGKPVAVIKASAEPVKTEPPKPSATIQAASAAVPAAEKPSLLGFAKYLVDRIKGS